jgi:hypothetical protein
VLYRKGMTVRIITEVIDNEERAVIINGRVFYDLDYLIETYGPEIDKHVHFAAILADEESINFAAGESRLITAIRESRANMQLEHELGVDGVSD